MSMSAHPPFEHNPHVYGGVNPEGNPTSSLVVHSAVAEPEPDDDGPVDVNGDGAVDGYEVFSKDDLIAECKGRTPPLPIYGTKADLVKRLQDADAAKAEQPADPEPAAEGGEQA